MSKCWDEVIDQRVQLKILGGGVGNLPLKLGAKMQKHEGHSIHTFAITDMGIAFSTW